MRQWGKKQTNDETQVELLNSTKIAQNVMLASTYEKFSDHRIEVHLGNFEMRVNPKSSSRSEAPVWKRLAKHRH